MVIGATLTAQVLINQTKFLCQQGLSLYHAVSQCRRKKRGSSQIVHDRKQSTTPSLPNPPPPAVFVDGLSPLSSTLKQATFHVFMNQAKMGKIEKLAIWE